LRFVQILSQIFANQIFIYAGGSIMGRKQRNQEEERRRSNKLRRQDGSTRVKTPGGTSTIPAAKDSANGSILGIANIISNLGYSIELQVLNKPRYDDLGQTTSIAQKLQDLFQYINRVDEDEANAILMKIIGILTNLEISNQTLTKKNKELEEADDKSWLTTSQTWAANELANEAEEHMAKLTEYTQDLYDRFEEKEGEYANLANEVKKEKEKCQDEIKRLKHFFEDQEIDIRIFTATGNLRNLKKTVSSISRITRQTQQDIATSLETVANDYQFLVKIYEDVKKIKAGIQELNDKIEIYRTAEANTLRQDIEKMKQQVQRIKIVFQITDHEAYFWGLVPGIEDMVNYKPLDLLVYQLRFNPEESLEKELEEYIKLFDKVKMEADDILRQKCEEEIKKEEEERQKTAQVIPLNPEQNSIPEQRPVEATSEKRTRRDDLIEMFMATLWAFIQEKINKAQLTGKNLGKRQGDFGKKPKVVANLLFYTEYIKEDTEREYAQNELVKILIHKGLIEFRKDISEEEYGEAKAFVTNSGRAFCQRLMHRYAELMQRVWQKQQDLIEFYRTRPRR